MGVGPAEFPEVYHLPGLHEPFSAISHLLGAAAFLILGVMLVRRGRGDRARMASLGIFAASCVLLLSLSGVYHLTAPGDARRVMERLDHCAIYVLIAGTFTPSLFILFRGWLRSGQLILVWAAALTAITLRTIFFDKMTEGIGLLSYLALGWFGGASAILIARRHGFAFIKPLLWGGIAYSVGGVISFARWPTFIPGVIHAHEAFHVAVLAGMTLHWLFIWQFASGHVEVRRLGVEPLHPGQVPHWVGRPGKSVTLTSPSPSRSAGTPGYGLQTAGTKRRS